MQSIISCFSSSSHISSSCKRLSRYGSSPIGQGWSAVLVAAGCILGHMYPCWLNFKGGKGVATSIGALITAAVSVAACVLIEWLISRFLLKESGKSIGDLSAALTGLLLAFNLPSNIDWWIVVLGALIAIGVGKMSFGGLGQNPFNPALLPQAFDRFE